MKKAIMVVSFGTSFPDTREKTIDRLENAISAAFPDRSFYRAWTSKMIIRKVNKRDNAGVLTVEECIEKLRQDGIGDILVQPTHVLNGIENDAMKAALAAVDFASVKIGEPILGTEADSRALIEIVSKHYAGLTDDTALVLMGHGTEHAVNPIYAALDASCKAQGHGNMYIGTVEATPTVEDVLEALKKRSDIKKLMLAPLMIVAGDHARNDMAGDEEDSWKSIFEKAGYTVSCDLRGLGEYDEIAALLADHAKAALRA